MIKVIAFDLDNTLYDHEQFVRGAYQEISDYVSKKHKINNTNYFQWILERWNEKGSSYNKIFLESYNHFRLNGFEEDIDIILDIYHNAKPEIVSYYPVTRILNYFKQKYTLVLITDGREETQTYKLQKLGLTKFFKYIYISGRYGKEFYKPSTKLFELCLEETNCDVDEIIYIGDNPVLDYEPCKNLGITFIRILKGEYKNIPLKHQYNANNFYELKTLIEKLENLW